MFLWVKKILAFIFPKHTLTAEDWYRLLASYFHPPKAQMNWMVKSDGLEMNWRQTESSLLETTE